MFSETGSRERERIQRRPRTDDLYYDNMALLYRIKISFKRPELQRVVLTSR